MTADCVCARQDARSLTSIELRWRSVGTLCAASYLALSRVNGLIEIGSGKSWRQSPMNMAFVSELVPEPFGLMFPMSFGGRLKQTTSGVVKKNRSGPCASPTCRPVPDRNRPAGVVGIVMYSPALVGGDGLEPPTLSV